MNNWQKRIIKLTESVNKYLCRRCSTQTEPAKRHKRYQTKYSLLKGNLSPPVIQYKIQKDKIDDSRYKWMAAGLSLLIKILCTSTAKTISPNSRRKTIRSTGKSCSFSSSSTSFTHNMRLLYNEPTNSNNYSVTKTHKLTY